MLPDSPAPGSAGTPTREIRSLTGLRGVAAALVMLYHAMPVSDVAAVERVFRHGYLAVDLFFVLSGFVIALSHAEITDRACTRAAYRDFLVRRVARVYPLYIATTILALLLFAALHMRGFESQLWHQPLVSAEIANVLMIQNWGLSGSFNGAAWSISAEAMAYLLFPLLCIPAFRAPPRVRLAWTCAAISLLVLLSRCPDFAAWRDAAPRLGPLDRTSHLSAASLLRCVAEFCIGMRVCALHKAMPPWLDRRRGLAAVLSLAAIACLAPVEGADWAIVLLYGPLIAGACGPGPVRLVLSRAPLHRLGVCSYSFYMLHVLVLDRRDAVAAALRLVGVAPSFAAVFCVAFALAVALAWPSWRYVERPSSAALRRLLTPNRRTNTRVAASAGRQA